MKERFWFAYYWVMILYLFLVLLTWAQYTVNYTNIYSEKDNWTAEPYMEKLEKHFLFSFIEKTDKSCFNSMNLINRDFAKVCEETKAKNLRNARIKNIYPFLLVFFMTLIRFIFTGKHIWQRPETS